MNLPFQRFFRYHEHIHNKNIREKKKVRTAALSAAAAGKGASSQRLQQLHQQYQQRLRNQQQFIPYLTILKKCFPQCLNVFLIFFVNLTVFPAINAGEPHLPKTRYYNNRTIIAFFHLHNIQYF